MGPNTVLFYSLNNKMSSNFLNVHSKLPTKLHFSLGEELVSSLSEKVHFKFACGFDGASDYIHKLSYLLVKPSTY